MRLAGWMLLLLTAAAPAAAQVPDTAAAGRHLAIRAAHLIDGRGGAVVQNAVILIDSTRITAVGAGLAIPPGTPVIDLGTATVLPGLIDCHTHVTGGDPGDYYEGIFRRSPIDYAVAAPRLRAAHARGRVHHRSATSAPASSSTWPCGRPSTRDWSSGPRMQVATLAVGATGGHGDLSGFSPYLKFGQFSGLADGADEIRKLVRFEVKNGADLIKLSPAPACSPRRSRPARRSTRRKRWTPSSRRPRMWGRKVAAHAHGAEASSGRCGPASPRSSTAA